MLFWTRLVGEIIIIIIVVVVVGGFRKLRSEDRQNLKATVYQILLG
jgi:hypothetical protein